MIIEFARIRRAVLIAYGLAIVGLTLVSTAADAQTAASRVFERLDTDRDEVIEPQEIQAARHAAFDRADADNDDYVTGTELEALREGIADEYGRGRGQRARAPEGARGTVADRVKRLDTDGDGRIAETEFVAAVDPLLQRVDGNGDGSITRAEMDEGASKAREAFRQRRGTL